MKHAHFKAAGKAHPRALPLIVPVQLNFSGNQTKKRGLSRSVFPDNSNFFRSLYLKINV